MTLVVKQWPFDTKKDAASLRSVNTNRLFCTTATALLSFILIACAFSIWHTSLFDPLSKVNRTDIQQRSRINLIKRAPVLISELPIDAVGEAFDGFKIAGTQEASPGLMTRSTEASNLEMKHASGRSSTTAKKPFSLSISESEPHNKPVELPILNHPVVQRHDQKRKSERFEVEQSDLQVKKAKAQRDAILQNKPIRKSEKGKRASELTISNISLAKAAIVNKIDQIKAMRAENKLQKVVKKAQEQGAVSIA